MSETDVIVVGLGAMGSATLWQLAEQGVSVLGIDMHAPPHMLGSSHGHSRVFRTAYFEHPSYVPLLLRARELWAELEAETRLFRQTGCLHMGPADHELMAGVRVSVATHVLPHEELDAQSIRARFPALRPGPDDVGIFEKEAGLLAPEAAIEEMLRRARLAGAQTRQDQVVKIDEEGASVRVDLGAEILRAKIVVLCVGAWLGQGAIRYDAPLTVMRQVQHWFAPKRDLGDLPCFIHVRGQRAFYGLPPDAGRGVKVCRHYGGDLCSPDTLPRELRAEDEDEVRAWMRDHLPDGDGEFEHAQVCMYGLTPDTHFVIGKHPQHSKIVLAGGFSGHGFKMAPAIGEVLADLATTGSTPHDIALFDPGRFA